MHEDLILQLGLVIILGILAQWIGWRLKLPAILPLLIIGFISGPVTGIIDPNELLGDLLLPVVSIFVAIILFEGGLSLRIKDIKTERKIGRVINLLISVGVIITWLGTTFFTHRIMKMDIRMAVLIGAILVVSGPTVIIPILNMVRPVNRVRSILQWEGILVDPVGASLSVLILSAISNGNADQITFSSILLGMGFTLLIGSIIGTLGAITIIFLLRRERIPDYLHSVFTLMSVILVYLIANTIRSEAGLMSVTIMGIVLANQKKVNIRKIATFKEELGIILLSTLFILLSARMELADFKGIIPGAILLVLFLVLILRPLTAWICTAGAKLPWQERFFTAFMAPRGIVSASVASIAAMELSNQGFPNSEQLVAFTFLVVVGTVTIYTLTARPLAKALNLIETNPQGTLIVGAHAWARKIAHAIKNEGFEVWLVDTNPENIKEAIHENLPAFRGNILSDTVYNQLPMSHIGRMLALTSNSELNTLAILRIREWIEKDNAYTLLHNLDGIPENRSAQLRKQFLFDKNVGFRELETLFKSGASIEPVTIEDDTPFTLSYSQSGYSKIPLFLIEQDTLRVFSLGEEITPKLGNKILYLVKP